MKRRQWSKTRAMEQLRVMLKRRYNQQVKDELRHLLRLLRYDLRHDAYTYVNYQQHTGLEYKMPAGMWSWLIEQQAQLPALMTLPPTEPVYQMVAGETCGAFMADGSPMV